MVLISKKQLVPTNANLAMVFIRKVSQSRLQVGQFEWSFPDLAHRFGTSPRKISASPRKICWV